MGQLAGGFRDPLAQRRNLDHIRAQPVKKVVAEPPAAAQVGQSPVGCRDHAAGETLFLVAAERRKGALLQHLQQLDLHRHRYFADLIEEQRAVRAAALEHALVMVDGAREGSLAVAEQLGLDQRLGKLRQVDRDEGVGEVGGEAAFPGSVRDELRAADRRRGGTLAGAGLAQQQGGEILHPVPEPRFVSPHVMREDVVPQRLSQTAHRFAFAGQRALDEVEGAPQLEEEREDAQRALFRQAAAQKLGDHVVGERHRERSAGLLRLLLDQRVELRHGAVVAHVPKCGLQ